MYYGAGVLIYGCTPNVVNNTITQNRCTSTSTSAKGGGTYAASGSLAGRNNIIYNNIATTNPETYGTVNVTYSCCSTVLTGTGNITDDPMFEDDFNLTWGSPCINTGDPNAPLDPDGTRADMGALYFHMGPGFEERPDEPTDFTVSHNNALLTATLDWTNPSMTVGGSTLTELTGVLVYRDEALVDDVTDVVIGAPYSYDDTTVPVAGIYDYVIVPYNSYGEGLDADASAWIGLDTPAEAQNAAAFPHWGYELSCFLTWENPLVGEHGGYWPQGSYLGQKVYRDDVEIADLAGSNNYYTDATIPETGFYTYSISYYNETGEGVVVDCDPAPVYVGMPQFEQIPYDWVEISVIGTNTGVTGDDQTLGPFNIGFNFPFYNEEEFNRVWICSNGWMSFQLTTSTAYTNAAIPNGQTPNNLLCPYWDDLTPYTGSGIYYYHDVANERFIVQYDDVPHYSTGGSYTFEVILYTDGKIDFMYNEMIHGTANSATVGCENAAGDEGHQVTYNGSGPLNPENEMGIRLYVAAEPPTDVTTDPGLETTPDEFALYQAYPNPFNPTTAISYQLAASSLVNLTVYDIAGRKVAELVNGWRNAGMHEVNFDASNLASGIYLYRLSAGDFTASGKMVLMK